MLVALAILAETEAAVPCDASMAPAVSWKSSSCCRNRMACRTSVSHCHITDYSTAVCCFQGDHHGSPGTQTAATLCEGVDSEVQWGQIHPALLHNLRVCVCVCLRCWSAHAQFRPWACCTLCLDYSAVREEKRELNNPSWLLILHWIMWLCYLDAVSKLLQSFGSNRFHGGDECWQLVLGTCCCALKTKINFTADYIYVILIPPLFTTIQTGTWWDPDLQRGVKLWLVHFQVSQDGEDGEDSWVVVSHDGPACCRHNVIPIQHQVVQGLLWTDKQADSMSGR